MLPKHLDEKVAMLHLAKLGVELETYVMIKRLILKLQVHSSQNITDTK
jgi:S-adenosylhomocysteine hydrolase